LIFAPGTCPQDKKAININCFHCRRCDIHPYGEGTDPNGNRMAAINIRCLDGIDLRKRAGSALRWPFVVTGVPSNADPLG
jgi:hypothetical protein